MNEIEFTTSGISRGVHDVAIILANDDPRETLVEAIVQSISTDLTITVGDTTMHLAAWMDPDHWEDDWLAAGVEDVDALLAGAVTTR